jgi:hypothetical protein
MLKLSIIYPLKLFLIKKLVPELSLNTMQGMPKDSDSKIENPKLSALLSDVLIRRKEFFIKYVFSSSLTLLNSFRFLLLKLNV